MDDRSKQDTSIDNKGKQNGSIGNWVKWRTWTTTEREVEWEHGQQGQVEWGHGQWGQVEWDDLGNGASRIGAFYSIV